MRLGAPHLHVLLLGLVLVTPACDGDDDADGDTPPCAIGDRALPPELQIVLGQPGGSAPAYVVASEGGAAPILTPPQGGKIVLAGVLAKNVGCFVQISASLRDECNGRALAVESRPVGLRARADGWGEPADPMQISDYSNLPICPRAQAERDLEGEPYLLTVHLSDGAGREAEASLRVVPTCAEPDALAACVCECDADYVLGQVCAPEPDAGVPPGTCPGDAGVAP